MNKRVIAIGDVHGCFEALKELVEKVIKFNPLTDTLVFMGDYIDRGKDSAKVVFYLQALKRAFPDNIILLKGNHEDLAINSLRQGFTLPTTGEYDLWEVNGGDTTIASFGGTLADAAKHLIPFIESLQLSYETDNHIFVHGGIPLGRTLSTTDPHDLLWDRCGWWFGEKRLVVGHTPKKSVTLINNLLYVDTACVYGGMLSAVDILSMEVFSVGGSPSITTLSIDRGTGAIGAWADKDIDRLKVDTNNFLMRRPKKKKFRAPEYFPVPKKKPIVIRDRQELEI